MRFPYFFILAFSFVASLVLNPKAFAFKGLELEIENDPFELCGPKLGQVLQKMRASQPEGYLSNKEWAKKMRDLGSTVDANTLSRRYIQQIPTAISAATGVPLAWMAPVIEVPNAYLIIASEFHVMNLGLSRASAFIEENVWLEDDDLLNHPDLGSGAGHDLKSSDLRVMYESIMRDHLRKGFDPSLSEFDRAKLSIEKAFWSEIIERLLERHQDEEFVIVSSQPYMPAEVISHEMWHARFFLDPVFRALVIEFYLTKVHADDKELFISVMEKFYQMIRRDGILAANENMAYTLQHNAYNYLAEHRIESFRLLAPLVTKYRAPFEAFLLQHGYKPLVVNVGQ